ncbi:MAG TPA: hypothetical protein GX686_11025 [Paracoccus sp.]|nr:hypothetical protein [Paracoccus sp. (in: a-proteobacteria)]
MRYLVLAAALMVPVAAQAATPTADWPCIQRLQPRLSLGQAWSGPPPAEGAAIPSATAALADRLVQRRLALDEAEADIADFAASTDAEGLALLMQAVFQRIDTQRATIIQGISRYGHAQVALAEQVETRRRHMAELETADPPDFDAIDAEERALDIDMRVFTDRQQSLTYVCESPVLLEQRLFALGRAIAAHLP